MRNTLSILSLIAFLFASSNAYSQSNKEPIYEIQFYGLSWDQYIDDLYYSSEEKDVNVGISSSRPSGPFRYVGPSPLKFYSISEDDEGVKTKKLEAEIPINQEASRNPLLLIFFKNPQGAIGDTKYRVLPLYNAVNFERLKSRNEVFVFNLSNSRLGFLLNDQSFLLAPQEQTRIAVKREGNNNYVLKIAQQVDDAWKLAFSTVWGSNPRTQNVLFIISDPADPNKIRVRRFPVTPGN